MSRPTKAELDQQEQEQEQEQADPETPTESPEEEDEWLWDGSMLLAYPGYAAMAESWSAGATSRELDLGKSSPEEWADFLKSIEEDLSK